jgi:hypothetical protein
MFVVPDAEGAKEVFQAQTDGCAATLGFEPRNAS